VRKDLPFKLEEYDLKENSTFLDIGSGFGKPVFHASMQTYCKSLGIEIVPARVAFTQDLKCNLEDEAKDRAVKTLKSKLMKKDDFDP
jgi:cyclopropane fatty-acyl-phospholipid synthase-like methyltransferase